MIKTLAVSSVCVSVCVCVCARVCVCAYVLLHHRVLCLCGKTITISRRLQDSRDRRSHSQSHVKKEIVRTKGFKRHELRRTASLMTSSGKITIWQMSVQTDLLAGRNMSQQQGKRKQPGMNSAKSVSDPSLRTV